MQSAAAGRHLAALRAHLAGSGSAEEQQLHESAPCSAVADADDETLLAQLGASVSPAAPIVDVAALQRVLEHDNWRTREGLKELMKDPIFVP